MRVSTRLIRNAASSYFRLGTTFLITVFTTWYLIGEIGVIGFGLMALAVSSTGPSVAVERALRFGLVRELAAAIASGSSFAMRRSLTSAFRLCLEAAVPLAALVLALTGLAWAGVFNTPEDQPELRLALAALLLGEGIHIGVRLLASPYLQSLFAAQFLGIDNLLIVLYRVTYGLSALLVFGWLLAGEGLAVQLAGYAVSRVTLQLTDVGLGIWIAKRRLPGLRLDRRAYDPEEYRAVRGTVWHTSHVTILLNTNPQLLAILINLFFGLPFNTMWQIAVQFTGYVKMFSEGLLRGVAPLATHLQQEGRMGAVIDLMRRSVRYQLALVLPAVVLLGVWVHPILDLWVGRRMAADSQLVAAGIQPAEALGLTASLALVLLAVRMLRSIFFGIERVLYGIGKVRSYAWFAKWAALGTVGAGWALMAWLSHPIFAALALLVFHGGFFPGVVLRAANRGTGMSVGSTLRRSAPRPLLAGLILLALMLPVRWLLPELTVLGLLALLVASGLVYSALALLLVAEPDERERLRGLLRQGIGLLTGRAEPEPPAPTGDGA